MNTGTARLDASTSFPRRTDTQPPRALDPWRQPLLMWGLIVAAALLSFYVHVLNDHVSRSDAQRTARASSPQAGQTTQLVANAQRAPQAVRGVQTAAR